MTFPTSPTVGQTFVNGSRIWTYSGTGPAEGWGITRRTLGRRPVDVRDFGATGNGTTDDYAAIQAAADTAGVGELYFPPGTYRTSATLRLTSHYATWRGETTNSSQIVGDLAVTPIVQVGNDAISNSPFWATIASIRVTRAAGTVPTNSIGIRWDSFGYGTMRDVFVNRSDVNVHLYGSTASVAVGMVVNNLCTTDGKTHHLKIENVAGLVMNGGSLGMNGADAFDCVSLLSITGYANDLIFTDVEFIPHGPSVVKPAAISFDAYLNTTGVFTFRNCNTENSSYCFISDAATPRINELNINGGRWASETGTFNLNAATWPTAWHIVHAGFSAPMILTRLTWSVMSGCLVGGPCTLVGGTYASAAVTGNVFIGALTLSGVWTKLAVGSNVVIGALTNTATGTVVVTGTA